MNQPIWNWALICVVTLGGTLPVARAGDILRGGAVADPARRAAAARANAGASEASAASALAKDRLARTTRIVESLRNAGNGYQSPGNVPNGLTPGGLVVATGANARWDGASLPTQIGSKVNIVQNEQTAVLHWESFNVGRNTHLNYDQSAGKEDSGKWIAFNRIVGAGVAPSEVLGKITAQGQVYIINQNKIIFGPGSQVQARTFVASTLPINDNLINQGLLNNRDAQFLFSALTVPGGSDGTPEFVPPPPPPSGRYGDVIVQRGALIQGPASADGNGGRIMLVGANVINEGVLSTPAGQTILAAGLQVGIQAHAQNDPSLRGLDVWVGAVGDYAGTVTNRGLIESRTGSITIVGKTIRQLGALESSTSVSLNGRIDLLASYGAAANPNFDNSGAVGFNGPIFLNQFSGAVLLGPNSVTRILPEISEAKGIPGTKLPEDSQMNVQGLVISFQTGAAALVPGGAVTIRAGVFPYVDIDNNRTIFTASGAVEPNLAFNYSGTLQRFLLQQGQAAFEAGSLVDVSGTTGAFVPLAQHILDVQLRGTELADSPLLRTSNVRGLALTVDIRRSGTYGGREWFGTPLGDLSGLLNIIERDVAQLTTTGGTIIIEAGDAVSVARGATLDASGGYTINEGGRIQTSRLRRGTHIIPIEDATPDVTYDALYTGRNTEQSAKWGIERTFAHPLAPLGTYHQKEYIEGAAGGTISFKAPTLLLAGELRGRTIKGPRQLDMAPAGSTLRLGFLNDKVLSIAGNRQVFAQSPYEPFIEVVHGRGRAPAASLDLSGGVPATLPNSARARFDFGTGLFAEDDSGFANVFVDNPEGQARILAGASLAVPSGGTFSLSGANVFIESSIQAPGATLSFTAYNFSPLVFLELQATGALGGLPAPPPAPGLGIVQVARHVRVSVAGLLVDDRPTGAVQRVVSNREIHAGSIGLLGYSVLLEPGSVLDASGGVLAKATGGFTYGRAGSISILAGQDPSFSAILGGQLKLEGAFLAYGGRTGGSLTLRATRVQIGGGSADPDTLVLDSGFFQRGGFSRYAIQGIGGRDAGGNYLPAVRVVSRTVLEPRAASWVLSPYGGPSGTMAVRAFMKPQGIRPPTSLTLQGLGADDPFVPPGGEDTVEAVGLVVMEAGSRITTDPGASVTLRGDSVAVLGTIEARGGAITIAGASSFRLSPTQASGSTLALPTVYIGPQARLDASGTVVLLGDPFGRRSGIIHPGGVIRVTGNIFAEAGAVLDVSGASAELDFHPSRLGGTGRPLVPRNAGVNSLPWGQRGVSARVDSDGGLIEMLGSQFLYSDATLLGRAGGPAALGGALSVGSGRFYAPGSPRTSADINMVVEQSGSATSFGETSLFGNVLDLMHGRADIDALFAAGSPNPGIGYFAVDQFVRGGFEHLDLGYFFFGSAAPVRYGGNIEFRGPVKISTAGFVRVAGGGIVKADSTVQITASYVAMGRAFQPPLNPADPNTLFESFDGSETVPFNFAPVGGRGSLRVNARLIDVGTLSLEGIGTAVLAANAGDIRGSGTLQLEGSLTLQAAQVYPTTLANFQIFAYDPPGATGSVSILQSGWTPKPLSAGGSLEIFATEILQSGTLLAPFGSLRLGWDGRDDNPATADFDQPLSPIAGSKRPTPVAQRVTLAAGSLTSVSGDGLLVPFGISPDGLTWVDPRGVDVTSLGLPEKRVRLSAGVVTTQPGSVIDLRGGGELFATRWLRGTGGSTNILGTALVQWTATGSYEAGDLVLFGGQTWSARVSINPADFAAPPEPRQSRYWALVAESFAIVPWFSSAFAPYNPYNTGVNSSLLGGDAGYPDRGLRLGERIYLEDSPGLGAGFYTLLPRAYGVLPGAYLVIPQEEALVGSDTVVSSTTPALRSTSHPIGTAQRQEGSFFVSGFTLNGFNPPSSAPLVYSRFELLTPTVLQGRARYERLTANAFMQSAAKRLGIQTIQRLPQDAGALSIHGNTGLSLAGDVLAWPARGGRGAFADISSLQDIFVTGGSGSAPIGATAVLDSSVLAGWGIDSLLLGGQRRQTVDGPTIDVLAKNLTVNNPGASLSGFDILLVATERLNIAPGSVIESEGPQTQPASEYLLTGDGVLVRVSGDADALISRRNVTGSSVPLLEIGSGARLAGRAVIVDSTYGTRVDPTAEIEAEALTLGSGQISVVLSPQTPPLAGTIVNPHLVIEGALLHNAQSARRLTLSSYRSVDVYGTGAFGVPALEELRIFASGLRGFGQGAGTARVIAANVLLANPVNVPVVPAPPGLPSGALEVTAGILRFGANAFSVAGYSSVALRSDGGFIAEASGSFATAGNLELVGPRLVTGRSVTHSLSALGSLSFQDSGTAAVVQAALGGALALEGSSVLISSDVLLPSGQASVRARTADLTVLGTIDTAGSLVDLYGIERFADAGSVSLVANAGGVVLGAGSKVSVAGASGGGRAGLVSVRSAGTFVSLGEVSGAGVKQGGTFLLDAGSIPSVDQLIEELGDGGFRERVSVRARTGSLTISETLKAREIEFFADSGGITLSGLLDASGPVGGRVVLAARGDLTVSGGISVRAEHFSSSGRGGSVLLEAGTVGSTGLPNPAAFLRLLAGATLDLGVDDASNYVAGDVNTPGSMAFYGLQTGRLHLRAPRVGPGQSIANPALANSVNIAPLLAGISDSSSVIAEGFWVYDRTAISTALNTAFLNTIHGHNVSFMANEAAIRTSLLTGSLNPAELGIALTVMPGAEVIHRSGDLILGSAGTSSGTDPAQDWNLASLRYGAESSPGILTIRAFGNLVFQNALSDGFRDNTPEQGFVPTGRRLWLATLMPVNPLLPLGAQSWTYRLAAGADIGSANFRAVRPVESVAASSGSVQLGNFYPATWGTGATGSTGVTQEAIAPGAGTTTRYQVIRTGTGDITIAAARDVQIRNPLATIYTAGVALPTPNRVFVANDFVVPVTQRSGAAHPSQGDLGAAQQVYPAQWAIAGGSVRITSGQDIRRINSTGGLDTSRQLPMNWLYRRGLIDQDSGAFGIGGTTPGTVSTVNDPSASTTWWIDYSNFFQGVGALGGGDVLLDARRDVLNVDAVAPTNARMPGRDPVAGVNVGPDPTKLRETGGGDLTVRAGRNISGGVYYVERGDGILAADGEITTNELRSPSLFGINNAAANVRDPLTWLATTLFLGKGSFEVSARADVLLGQVANPFWLPVGINNKTWNKSYFHTFSPESSVEVTSLGGDIRHRLAVVLPGTSTSRGALQAYIETQQIVAAAGLANRAANFQPWIRTGESSVLPFVTALSVTAPTLRSTALAGDIAVSGTLNLFPAPRGTLELLAAGSFVGFNPIGNTTPVTAAQQIKGWISARVNLSDASPASQPSSISPIGYQSIVGRSPSALNTTRPGFLGSVDSAFRETGSFTGAAASVSVKRALHDPLLLHRDDPEPLRIFAAGGDITGLTLFSAKQAHIHAQNDITDIAFYLQNVTAENISLVSAGRDIVPYNENSPLRVTASNAAAFNTLLDPLRPTVRSSPAGGVLNSQVLAGDIQVSGPGFLEVLAGRNLDLGTGPNYADGTGVGITSIGRSRNPFLPFAGASLITLAGVGGPSGGPALGLLGSTLNLEGFMDEDAGGESSGSTPEHKAIDALLRVFALLREVGAGAIESGDYSAGYAAIAEVFGEATEGGEIFTRARDIRTTSGGSITLAAPGGSLAMAPTIFGNPLTPPGIVTEYGGAVNIFVDGSVDIGQARIFTLRGGDLTIWASAGDIAAGTAPKTVVTAPPTRVTIDVTSADVQTDLGGLATGGGIGVLASVEGVEPGNVVLIAPQGTVDAGDAGIRATGDIQIAAAAVLNADNIAAGGTSTGVPTAPPVAAPNIGGLSSAAATTGAAASAGTQAADSARPTPTPPEEQLSTIEVEVLGYGGDEEEEEEGEETQPGAAGTSAARGSEFATVRPPPATA